MCDTFQVDFQAQCQVCSLRCIQLLSQACKTDYISYARIGYAIKCGNNLSIPTSELTADVYSRKEYEWLTGNAFCTGNGLGVLDQLGTVELTDTIKTRTQILVKVLRNRCKTGSFVLDSQPKRSSETTFGFYVSLLPLISLFL